MSLDGQGTKWRRNIAENFNRPGCTSVTDRRQTDGRATAYSEREHEFTFAKNLITTLLMFVEDGITKKAQREKPLIKTRMLTFKVLIPNLTVAKPYAVTEPWQIQSHGFTRNTDDVSQNCFLTCDTSC